MTIEENKERELLIMSLISLQNSSELEVTILSNRFIDNFMPRANGEFVKVYIYLLRAVSIFSGQYLLLLLLSVWSIWRIAFSAQKGIFSVH